MARLWGKQCLRVCTPTECNCAAGASAQEVLEFNQRQIEERAVMNERDRKQRLPRLIAQAEREGRHGDALAMSLEYEPGSPSAL